MQYTLIQFGLWVIKQSWFQFAVVKFITSKIESTDTKKDDAVLAFIRDNKRSLTTIAKKELDKVGSAVDERFTAALKTIK